MNLRRDALAAAAEWIGAVERFGITATVGSLTVAPNAVNAISGEVIASLDLRHPCDSKRYAACEFLLQSAYESGQRRGVAVSHELRLDQLAVPMDGALRTRLAAAVEAVGYPVHHMDSGAGHDAMIVAPHMPSAMLFLRSPGGVSHHPDENVLVEDVEAALRVGARFIRDFAHAC
jgi:allantoate deiminase